MNTASARAKGLRSVTVQCATPGCGRSFRGPAMLGNKPNYCQPCRQARSLALTLVACPSQAWPTGRRLHLRAWREIAEDVDMTGAVWVDGKGQTVTDLRRLVVVAKDGQKFGDHVD